MKRMLLGISLIVCGTLGVLALIFSVIPMSQTLGSVNGNSSIFVYLNWYELTPLFYVFLFMGILGLVICTIEAYFNKSAK